MQLSPPQGHFMFDTRIGGASSDVPDVLLESASKTLVLGAKGVFALGKKDYVVPFTADSFTSTCLG